MKHIIITWLLIAGLGGFVPAWPLEDDLAHWTQVILQSPLDKDKKILGYLEIQPRVSDNLTDLDQLLLRPALGYQVNNKLSLWQGYGWTPLFQPRFRDEHRLWQQVLYSQDIRKWLFINRFRFEERFIEDADTSLRVRNMVRLSRPVGKQKRWYFVVYDEVFWNANTAQGAPQSGFNQNRLFAGFGRNFNQYLRAELGYLHNYINRQAPMVDKVNHVIMLTIFAIR